MCVVDKCYKISGGNWTWMDGKEFCEDFGAIMAFPQDQDDLVSFRLVFLACFTEYVIYIIRTISSGRSINPPAIEPHVIRSDFTLAALRVRLRN